MKHKNSEVIKAWLDGEECELWSPYTERWIEIAFLHNFDNFDIVRIKPKPDKALTWGEGYWVIGGSWRVFVKNKPKPHEIKNAEIIFGWEWEDKK